MHDGDLASWSAKADEAEFQPEAKGIKERYLFRGALRELLVLGFCHVHKSSSGYTESEQTLDAGGVCEAGRLPYPRVDNHTSTMLFRVFFMQYAAVRLVRGRMSFKGTFLSVGKGSFQESELLCPLSGGKS